MTSCGDPNRTPCSAMVLEKANPTPMRSARSEKRLSAARRLASGPLDGDRGGGGVSDAAERRTSTAAGASTSAYAAMRQGPPRGRRQTAIYRSTFVGAPAADGRAVTPNV